MIKDLSLAWSFLFNLLQQINAIIPIFLYSKIKRILPVPFCFIQQVYNSWLYLNEDNMSYLKSYFSLFILKWRIKKKWKCLFSYLLHFKNRKSTLHVFVNASHGLVLFIILSSAWPLMSRSKWSNQKNFLSRRVLNTWVVIQHWYNPIKILG